MCQPSKNALSHNVCLTLGLYRFMVGSPTPHNTAALCDCIHVRAVEGEEETV